MCTTTSQCISLPNENREEKQVFILSRTQNNKVHILEMQRLQEISVSYWYSAYRLLSQAPQISCVIWHSFFFLYQAGYLYRQTSSIIPIVYLLFLAVLPSNNINTSLPTKKKYCGQRWKKSCNRPYLTRFRPLLPKTLTTAYHFTSVDSSWAASTSSSYAHNRRYHELVFVPIVKLILT